MKNSSELYENPSINYMEVEEPIDSCSNEITFVFGQIFSQEIDLFEKNDFLYGYIDTLVLDKNYEVIIKLLESEYLFECPPSILKTILLMTESIKNIDNISSLRTRVESKLNQLLS